MRNSALSFNIDVSDVALHGAGESKKMRGYNRIRRGIKRFFPSRRCFVLPLPTSSSSALTHVDRLKDSELSPTFVAAANQLFDFVLDHTSGRIIAGRPIDGSSTSNCLLNFFSIASSFNLILTSRGEKIIP